MVFQENRRSDHGTPLIQPIPIAVVLVASMMLLFGCGGGDGGGTDPEIRHVQDFFPQEIGGMTADGSPTTATTAAELQDLIDGGYEIYTNHNFQEFAEQRYEGTVGGSQAVLIAWIFELATVEDAQELHDDEQVLTGACNEAADLGDQARLCLSLGSETIQFQRDRYWVRLNIDIMSADAEEVLGLVAGHIDQEITS